MKYPSGARYEAYAARAIGAVCSVGILALVTACDAGSQQVRIENYCDRAIKASYSTFVFEESPDASNPSGYAIEVAEGAAIEVAAGTSSTLKTEIYGAGYLVVRGSDGDWFPLAPLDTEAPPDSDGGFIKDGVFVVDGVLCTQLGS